MSDKREEGLGIVMIGCFSMAFYILVVFYLDHTADLDYRLWDLSTLTAADFTAEVTIHPDQWNELILMSSRVTEPMPTHAVPSMTEMRKPIVTLAQHLENELVRRLERLPAVLKQEPTMKVAHISFAFDNKELLEALISRGSLITEGKFDKLAKINDKIDRMAVEDADKISRPVAAFRGLRTRHVLLPLQHQGTRHSCRLGGPRCA